MKSAEQCANEIQAILQDNEKVMVFNWADPSFRVEPKDNIDSPNGEYLDDSLMEMD